MSPRTDLNYRLVPEAVPARGGRSGFYDGIVREFIDGKASSARVVIEGRKPAAIRLSLKKAVDRSGSHAAVVARGQNTYQVKK
jgi:hypothetical protein